MFEELVRDAFSTRSSLTPVWDIPGARASARLICTYLYKSDGINRALQTAFNNQSKLFGDTGRDGPELSKIAVVATGEEEERPLLLTNYNREWRVNDDESKQLLAPFHGHHIDSEQITTCGEKRNQKMS
jgi:hypothetical protein